MKVLFVDHTERKSGAAISFSTLVRALRKEAIEPCFLLRNQFELDELFEVSSGTPCYHARFVSMFPTTMYVSAMPILQHIWQIAKAPLTGARAALLASRWKCSIAHINETALLADAYVLASCNFPVLVHARTALNKRAFERFVLKKLATFPCVRFVAIDDEVRDTLPESCRDKCVVVHNPIEIAGRGTEDGIVLKRTEWGVDASCVVVGQLASLHQQKGVWEILEIAQILCPKYPELRFVLIGDTHPSKGLGVELAEAIRQRGLTGKVLLPGFEIDLANVYGALDICLCLFGAGLGGVGRTAYEAAICGKPVIATLPRSRNSPTLSHERHGLLYEPGDMRGVQDGIESLVLNPVLRKELGQRAKCEIGGRHVPEYSAKKIAQIYSEMLGFKKVIGLGCAK